MKAILSFTVTDRDGGNTPILSTKMDLSESTHEIYYYAGLLAGEIEKRHKRFQEIKSIDVRIVFPKPKKK